jgi:hypothetical protein
VDFDLRPTSAAYRRSARGARYGFSILAAVFVVVWGVTILPQFFEAPHTTEVCSNGHCGDVAPSGFYQNLAVYTGVLLGLALLLLVLGYWSARGSAPTNLSVDASGFRIDSGPDRSRRVDWNDPKLSFYAYDRGAVPVPIVAEFGHGYTGLPRPAFDAILASARSAGAGVSVDRLKSGRTGYRIYPTTRAGVSR